jgi:hypothetical protein
MASRFAEVRVDAAHLAALLMPGVDATVACARFDYSKMQVVFETLGRDVPPGGHARIVFKRALDATQPRETVTAKLEPIIISS